MDFAALRRTAIALSCLAFVAGPSRAAEPEKLSGYNADIRESSISGISSGAFMAVQFGTAWSSVIKGVGAVAGGPYWCAKADANDIMNGYMLPVMTATGSCMKGPPRDMNRSFEKADAKSASGDIDPLELLRRQKIYLFHGYNDAVVARSVTDAAADFYRHYLGEANRGNLYYQTTVGAGHSLAVAPDKPIDGLNECQVNAEPFINTCGYDQAGIILQHIYGALNAPNQGSLTGTIKRFDQSVYAKPNDPGLLGLDSTGYVFVPGDCEQGAVCRVHIALHGCKQNAGGDIGRRFIDDTGYNAWADSNRLIVLYPQTTASPFAPFNPQACWDWWSYVNHSDNYVTKSGVQIRIIKAMLDALTAGAAPAPAAAAPSGAPNPLKVIDTSDTSADLAWTPLAAPTAYRIFRAGADGAFTAVADAAGPSFADSGLTPRTAYRWRISPIVNGTEGPASNDAAATTRVAPAPCQKPGTCPIGP